MVLERPYKVLYVASRLRIFSIYLIEPGEQWWTEAPQCLYVIVTMTLSQHPSTTSPQCHALNTTSGMSCLPYSATLLTDHTDSPQWRVPPTRETYPLSSRHMPYVEPTYTKSLHHRFFQNVHVPPGPMFSLYVP